MVHLFGRIYDFLAPRRFFLLAFCALVFCVCTVFVSRLVVLEDIRTMLPDDSGQIVSDLELLRLAPFAQRLTITVSHPGADPTLAANALANALRTQDVFTRVLTGPPGEISLDFLTRLLIAAPALLTDSDMDALGVLIEPENVRAALARSKRDLLSPGGLALKNITRHDPLGIRNVILPKLASVSRLADVRVEKGQFVSRDGAYALVLGDTDIPMTDSLGAAKVMASYQEALTVLPAGAQAKLVGGHRHTDANARAIKDDLAVILPTSIIVLALIFFFFMRTRQSLYVFLVPVFVVSVGGAATAVVYGSISGIVLGFGAVLLGITVDYALHVFFVLHKPVAGRHHSPAYELARIAPPIIFGALTSCAAFAALLISNIPGIRQLAVFSLFSLLISLLVSLIVLPHFVTPMASTPKDTRGQVSCKRGGVEYLFAVWIILLGAGLWLGLHTRINGDLRELGYIPENIRADEESSRRVWGSMRDVAMIFAHGATFDAALAGNDKVWKLLQAANAANATVSLAPILPAQDAQHRNIKRWRAFWQANGAATLALVDAESASMGFSSTAFAPFAEFITATPEPISVSSVQALGLQELVDMLSVREGTKFLVLTLLPDTVEFTTLLSDESERDLDARFVSGSRFRDMVGQTMRRDVLRFSGLALAAVVLLTALLFRDLGKTMLALLPIGAGVTTVLAAMQLFGQALNLFHVVSLPLIIGLGADYGIFMVCTEDPATRARTVQAVLFSGLTTLGGFGVLVLARHPALHSIGITVLAGIGAAMVTALWAVPRLSGERT